MRRVRGPGVALATVLALGAPGTGSTGAAASERMPGGSESTCFEPRPPGTGLAARVADAVAVLRAAGHDPEAYQLELRDGDGPSLPLVVFRPRQDPTTYPVVVRPEAPCLLTWLWDPGRFTPWQVAVLDRARELLTRESAPPGEAELERVSVVETAETVAVRLEIRLPGQARSAVAEREVTLVKQDLPAADAPAAGR